VSTVFFVAMPWHQGVDEELWKKIDSNDDGAISKIELEVALGNGLLRQGDEIEEHEEEDIAMNPAVIRLNKDLEAERSLVRRTRRDWRTAQAETLEARAEAEKATRERDMSKKAEETSRGLATAFESQLGLTQKKFVDSDVRNGLLVKESKALREKMKENDVVVLKFTGELLDARTALETAKLESKSLLEKNSIVQSEIVNVKAKYETVEEEAKKLRIENDRRRKQEQEAKAQAIEAFRRVSNLEKEVESLKSQLVEREAYADKMREEASAAKTTLVQEQKSGKDLSERLKAKSSDFLDLKEKNLKTQKELNEDQIKILGLRKDKSDADTVARGLQRELVAALRQSEEAEAQVKLLQSRCDERYADCDSLRKKLDASEAKVEELTTELRDITDKERKARSDFETANLSYKKSLDDMQGVRKEVANERNASRNFQRELIAARSNLSKSDEHSDECNEVIERLTVEVQKEHQKFLNAQEIIQELRDKLQRTERNVKDEKTKVSDVEAILTAVREELAVTHREADTASTVVTKLTTDLSGVNNNLRNSDANVSRLEESLDGFRQALVKCESDLKKERSKTAELNEEMKILKQTLSETNEELKYKIGESASWQEKFGLKQREIQDLHNLAEVTNKELKSVRDRCNYAEDDVAAPKLEKVLQEIEGYQAKGQELEEIIVGLRKQVKANLVRAEKAEAMVKEHDARATIYQEQAEVSKLKADSANEVQKKMATRLNESQVKLPPLQQDASCYKAHVERLLGELDGEKKKLNKSSQQSHDLAKDLKEKREEADALQSKVPYLENELRRVNESLLLAQTKLKDEEILRRQLIKEFKSKTDEHNDAEFRAKEYKVHVERLLEELRQAHEAQKPKPALKASGTKSNLALKKSGTRLAGFSEISS